LRSQPLIPPGESASQRMAADQHRPCVTPRRCRLPTTQSLSTSPRQTCGAGKGVPAHYCSAALIECRHSVTSEATSRVASQGKIHMQIRIVPSTDRLASRRIPGQKGAFLLKSRGIEGQGFHSRGQRISARLRLCDPAYAHQSYSIAVGHAFGGLHPWSSAEVFLSSHVPAPPVRQTTSARPSKTPLAGLTHHGSIVGPTPFSAQSDRLLEHFWNTS
jgi:hypothetical protein